MKALGVCGLAVLLAACAEPPLKAEGASDAEGKQFSPPTSGRAALYVTNEHMGAMEVSLGQRTLGTIGPGMWLRADFPAGTYDVRCRAEGYAFRPDNQRVSFSAGETTYMYVRFVALADVPCRVALQDPAAGRAAVLRGSRAREVTGASD